MKNLLYSVRTRVFLIVIGMAAISITGHLVVFEPFFSNILMEHELQQVYSAANTTAQTLDLETNLAVQSLESITKLEGFGNLNQQQIEKTLATFDATNPFFIYTWAMDSTGKVIAAPARSDRLGEDRSSRDYFTLTTPQNPTHFQKVRVSTRGRFSLVVGTVILNEEGEKVGIVAGSLGLMDRNPQLYQAVLAAPFPDQYRVFLVTSDNILLAHSDKKLPQPSQKNLKSLSDQPFMKYFETGDRVAKSITHQGQKYIVGFASVPTADWTVIVLVPDSFVAESVSNVTKRLSTILGIMLFFLLSISLFFAERFSSSLGSLTMALKNFGEEGKAELAITKGGGEIKDAITAFNIMVADRQKVDSQLQESEARFRTLVEQAADAFFLHNLEGELLDVNQRACDSLGYTREELLSMSVTDIDAVSVNKNYKMGIWKNMQPDSPVTVEGVHRCKDGTSFPVEVRIGMLITDNDKCILALARDISDRKKHEEELRQAQKMEAIGTLAGGIAHDFNNILTAIFGNIELAKMKADISNPLYEHLEAINKSAIRSKKLVEQILTFSRKTEQNKHPLRIDVVLKEAMKLLRSSIPTTIEIKEDIVSQSTVVADSTQVHQIIMNLCTNAYHAMREKGGTLGVALKDVDITIDDVAMMPELSVGKYVELVISDSGSGINQEIMDKIFEPYFTTNESGGGTGLGLAVVHGIVKGHNGYISVYSKPNQGTTFHVYLPASEEDAKAEEMLSEADQLTGGTEHIMFIDDEENNATVAKEILTRYGYQVDIFTNGVEAWQQIQKQPDKYDLVITDMTMPFMTGTELAQKIIEIRPRLPIILCTGYSEMINREKSLAMGISEYMKKPMSMSELVKSVRQTLDMRDESIT